MASGIDKLSNLVTQAAELAKEELTKNPEKQENKSDGIPQTSSLGKEHGR